MQIYLYIPTTMQELLINAKEYAGNTMGTDMSTSRHSRLIINLVSKSYGTRQVSSIITFYIFIISSNSNSSNIIIVRMKKVRILRGIIRSAKIWNICTIIIVIVIVICYHCYLCGVNNLLNFHLCIRYSIGYMLYFRFCLYGSHCE